MSDGADGMNEAQLFLTYCRLTCFGGSEKGTCSCKCPNDCKLTGDPRFYYWRIKAQQRMLTYLRGNGE